VIQKLNAGFVNTWVLRNDMIRYAGPGGQEREPIPESQPNDAKQAAVSPDLRAFAREVREHYTYPVDSLIFDADGKFVADLAASDLLMDFSGGDKRYLDLLAKAPGGSSK
jgi:hypothetical protein